MSGFRDEPAYVKRLNRFDKAVRQVGYDGDIHKLIGTLDVDYLEDLMLASYSLMKYIRGYMRTIEAGYVENSELHDIYTAIQEAVEFTDGSTKYRYLDQEATKMEIVSRAAFAWLKSLRLLKPIEPRTGFGALLKKGLQAARDNERSKLLDELKVANTPAVIEELLKRIRELEAFD